MKIKLFRRGHLVGIVNDDFYDEVKKVRIWDKLDLPQA